MEQLHQEEVLIRACTRNNRLFGLMKEHGFGGKGRVNVAAFSRKIGIGQNVIGDLLNIKIIPMHSKNSRFGRSGEYIHAALKIAEYFNVEVEELFPIDMYLKVKCSKTERPATLEELPKLISLMESYCTEPLSGIPIPMKIMEGSHE
ncbi:MAG TPA: hypothetical protein VF817_02090 [Patescibacteria group bacterium]